MKTKTASIWGQTQGAPEPVFDYVEAIGDGATAHSDRGSGRRDIALGGKISPQRLTGHLAAIALF